MELTELLGEMISPDIPESSITSDSNIGFDGNGVHIVSSVNTFNMETAINIDSRINWQDSASLIFLTVNEKEAAIKLLKMVEEKEENKMYELYGIFQLFFQALQMKNAPTWPDYVYQSLFQIGHKSILYYDLEIDIEDKEKQLQEAQKIIPERLLLFTLAENMDSSEQQELENKLREHYPPLMESKMMETTFLQMLIAFSTKEVCIMIDDCLNRMNRPDLVAIFKEGNCGSKGCMIHETHKESYKTGSGFAVIINQMDFCDNPDLPNRTGTDKDRDELKATFALLGVEPRDIWIYDNLADTEMRNKLMEAARHANNHHKDYAWLAVVVLSHGRRRNNKDEVLGVNGEGVEVDEIRDMFTAETRKCPHLQDKPKLFWIQACRDSANEDSVNDLDRPKNITADNAVPINTLSNKPAHINFFVQCSTIAGHIAHRDINNGSFFIQNLCQVFQKNADTLDLMSMINIVTKKVSEAHKHYPNLCEVTNFTLTAKVMFHITEQSKRRFQEIKKSGIYN